MYMYMVGLRYTVFTISKDQTISLNYLQNSFPQWVIHTQAVVA